MKELAHYAKILFGIHLSPSQLKALKKYEEELLDWNTRISLTAIREPEKIRIKHFLDSFSCMCAMQESTLERLIDVGTGAGFPGLPLKIILPDLQLTLVESVGKKADFCRHIVQSLQLKDVQILQERAEVVGQDVDHRESYDWAIARAVGNMRTLAEYLIPLVKVGGAMLAMKGESGPAEAHAAEKAFDLLGGHLRKIIPVTLPGVVDQRYLIVVDKVAASPHPYPRRVGLPAKKPL
ncbi:MAG: 16S rRNA (guanine(527)-N(7))-methyltransferase RsmG [Anaerolineales bacterium]